MKIQRSPRRSAPGGTARATNRPFLGVVSDEEAERQFAWVRDNGANTRYAQESERFLARMRQGWGESMAWGRRIAQVFYRLPKVGYQLGIKRPTAPQRIAQILSGEMGYGDIAQRVIKRLVFQGRST